MEGIQHRIVAVNGINMHVAEKGDGPAILFLHGFPEIWYTWRHQINGLAARGYRAIAPDLRGYGDTDAPISAEAYSIFHIVGDLVALLDTLSIPQVFLVGHDWGALIAWSFCLFRPDRIKALVNLSVCFRPRNPQRKPIETLKALCGEDYYICRFQEPGVVEAEFDEAGTKTIIRRLLTARKPGPPVVPKGGFAVAPAEPIPLPSWLTEEDVEYYASKFDKSGFHGGLNYYRNLDRNWELTAPWAGVQIKIPVKFIVGDLDITYTSLGSKEYIHDGRFQKDVPFLQEVVVLEGVAHYLNQEKADEVNQHIYSFFQKM